jgi:hypothetical protein
MKLNSMEIVLKELKKEMERCRSLSIENQKTTAFYYWDSMSEHLRELIHEAAKIRDLLYGRV